MTEIQLLRLNWLLENTLKDCNRRFVTMYTMGYKLYGNYYIGTYQDKQFYIKVSFLVIAFLPLLPIAFYLTFNHSEDQNEYIVGKLPMGKLKELNKFGVDSKRIIFSGYLNGFFGGALLLAAFALAMVLIYFILPLIRKVF